MIMYLKSKKVKNIIEKAPTYHSLGRTHYLPHKPVTRHDEATTKLRIVFNASAKVDGLPSILTVYTPVRPLHHHYSVFFYVSE